eukprot:m.491402 g.491402  ORF g.491402 m.491402 type:complete len:396 (-) comp29876_c0_seq1:47-1234(-)
MGKRSSLSPPRLGGEEIEVEETVQWKANVDAGRDTDALLQADEDEDGYGNEHGNEYDSERNVPLGRRRNYHRNDHPDHVDNGADCSVNGGSPQRRRQQARARQAAQQRGRRRRRVTETDTSADADKWQTTAIVSGGAIFFTTFLVLGIVSRHKDPPVGCEDCEIIGTHQALIAQGVLPAVALVAVLAAFYFENPRRTFVHFIADNSKQAVSSGASHGVGTVTAIALGKLVDHVDECDWYMVVFTWDAVIGCSLSIWLHKWSAEKAPQYEWSEHLSRIGDYERPKDEHGLRAPSTNGERCKRWLSQTLHWTVCVVLARLVVFGLLWALHGQLAHIATLIGEWGCHGSSITLKTWLSVVIIPVVVDVVQVVIQDLWLKPSAEIIREERDEPDVSSDA